MCPSPRDGGTAWVCLPVTWLYVPSERRREVYRVSEHVETGARAVAGGAGSDPTPLGGTLTTWSGWLGETPLYGLGFRPAPEHLVLENPYAYVAGQRQGDGLGFGGMGS